MGARTIVIAVLAATASAMAASPASTIKDRDCLECHSDKDLYTTNAAGMVASLFADESLLKSSVHKGVACAGCHDDLTVKHPDDNVAAKRVDCVRCHSSTSENHAAGIHGRARLSPGQTRPGRLPDCTDCHGSHAVNAVDSPASSLYFSNVSRTCGQCHGQPARDVAESVHGRAIAAGHRDAATCADCHTEHKSIRTATASALQISKEICAGCHASERINTKYHLPSDRVRTFFESYHGLAAQYGGTRAANCASCHGVHKILPSTDPNSTIARGHLQETCGKCHPGAGAEFVEGRVHVDVASAQAAGNAGERINWWVRKVYLVMIVVVISAMAFHNLLILGRKAAVRARLYPRPVQRMNAHQRVQHALLAFSFIVLAWTGFALKYPDTVMARALGTSELFRSWTHRIAGVTLLAVGAWHLGYVGATREGRRMVRDLAPGPGDLRDLKSQALYLTGFAKIKPAFPRFGYAEKMEYWAVVWGTVIMGGSGLMIWFKMETTRFLPRWAVDVATTIHYYEAILACLAIVVWHFYHVIFDPDVYPLNLAALDGRVSRHWIAEEHPLDPTALPAGTDRELNPTPDDRAAQTTHSDYNDHELKK